MAKVRLQHRRGTASQWVSVNPVLAAGEMGFETDTQRMKVGNGTQAWTALSYSARTFDVNVLDNTVALALGHAEDAAESATASAASAAAAAVSATASGKSKLWIASTSPSGIATGDLWVNNTAEV